MQESHKDQLLSPIDPDRGYRGTRWPDVMSDTRLRALAESASRHSPDKLLLLRIRGIRKSGPPSTFERIVDPRSIRFREIVTAAMRDALAEIALPFEGELELAFYDPSLESRLFRNVQEADVRSVESDDRLRNRHMTAMMKSLQEQAKERAQEYDDLANTIPGIMLGVAEVLSALAKNPELEPEFRDPSLKQAIRKLKDHLTKGTPRRPNSAHGTPPASGTTRQNEAEESETS